jgi:predicted dehydrogenase
MMRAVLIGAGSIASRHVAVLSNISGVEIAGVMDVNEPALQRFAEHHGVPAFNSLERLFDEARPDYALILTPRAVREQPMRACVERDVPFLVEKPPCHNMTTGNRLQQLLSEYGTIHAVGFMHRYSPAVDVARDILAGNELSTLSVEIRTPLAQGDGWRQRPVPFDVAASGGIIGEVGIHYIDTMRYLSGSNITRVKALGSHQMVRQAESADAAVVAMQLESGVLATMAHTWCAADWYACVTATFRTGTISVLLMGDCQRVWGRVDGKEIDFSVESQAEHRRLHEAFLTSVTAGDMAGVRTPYGDALETFQTSARINRELYGETGELD